MIIALTVLAANFIIDIVYGLIDRIKAAQLREADMETLKLLFKSPKFIAGLGIFVFLFLTAFIYILQWSIKTPLRW